MKQYLNLLSDIMTNGEDRGDRTGVGTRSVFGRQLTYDLAEGFPLLTTKRVPFKSVVTELLWFIAGRTDNRWLNEHGCTIWDEWATPEQTARFGRKEGDLGPVYGHQWRNFGATWDGKNYWANGVDQLTELVEGLKNNPMSRRHIITAWNPAEADQVTLPPCHSFMQFYVHNDGRLDCQMYQRSADVFLGVPFNIASYALLTTMLARVCGLKPGTFVHTFGDVHIYSNHHDQVREQLSRLPHKLPSLLVNPAIKDITRFTLDDLELIGYNPMPSIAAPVAV